MCNTATGGLDIEEGVRLGLSAVILSCRMGVRIKATVNMVNSWELLLTRLTEEM